jgi:hypothetical protein
LAKEKNEEKEDEGNIKRIHVQSLLPHEFVISEPETIGFYLFFFSKFHYTYINIYSIEGHNLQSRIGFTSFERLKVSEKGCKSQSVERAKENI